MSASAKSLNPLRILHVTFDMRIGGTEQVIRNLITGADTGAVAHSIFCIEEPLGPWGEDLKAAGTRIDSINRRSGFDLGVVKALRNSLRDQHADVLHCHQYTPWVYGVLAALGTGTRVIFTEHGRFYPDTASPKRRFINPLLERATSQVTAISEATRRALVKYEYLHEVRIEVIYNGIHGLEANADAVTELKSQLGIPAEAIVLGTIARLDPIKNHGLMLRAFRRVLNKQPHCWLLLIGDGETRETCERLIGELGLGERVLMPGYIEQPAVWLDAMDIYLLSSFSEGTSMTLLEALSLGKPCVVTDVGGNPEVIRDGETGCVTPSDDEEAFAAACLRLVESEATRKKMASAARQDFAARFHASIMQQCFDALYGRVTHSEALRAA